MTLRVSGSGDPAEISRRMLGTDSREKSPDSFCVLSPRDGTCAGRGIPFSIKGPFQRPLDSAPRPFVLGRWNLHEARWDRPPSVVSRTSEGTSTLEAYS